MRERVNLEMDLAAVRAFYRDNPAANGFFGHANALTLLAALDAAEADAARLRDVREFVANYFAPWGSWKTGWWEHAGRDGSFNGENAMRAIQRMLADQALAPPPAPALSAMPDREIMKRQIAADPDVETEADKMHPAARAEAGPSEEAHRFIIELHTYIQVMMNSQNVPNYLETLESIGTEAARALDRLAGRT